MPTLMYLYPDYAYFDNASLSKYGTETKDRLGLITTDVVKNTANPDLRPARSTKWEAGLSFRINRIKGFCHLLPRIPPARTGLYVATHLAKL